MMLAVLQSIKIRFKSRFKINTHWSDKHASKRSINQSVYCVTWHCRSYQRRIRRIHGGSGGRSPPSRLGPIFVIARPKNIHLQPPFACQNVLKLTYSNLEFQSLPGEDPRTPSSRGGDGRGREGRRGRGKGSEWGRGRIGKAGRDGEGGREGRNGCSEGMGGALDMGSAP